MYIKNDLIYYENCFISFKAKPQIFPEQKKSIEILLQ